MLSLALTLTLSAWTVEAAPLVPAPRTPSQVAAIDDWWVAALTSTDGGTELFVTNPEQAPRSVMVFPEGQVEFSGGAGTGLSVVATSASGTRLFRVRNGATPAIDHVVDLDAGQLDATSCDDALTECVFVIDREFVRWTKDGLSPLLDVSGSELSTYGYDPRGVAVHPQGGLYALAAGTKTLLFDPGRHRLSLVQGAVVKPVADAKELLARNEDEAWQRSFEKFYDCETMPQGWDTDGSLLLLNDGFNEVGSAPCLAGNLRLDPKTLRTKPVPTERYPWSVLDCPHGGWSSPLGTFVTRCPTIQDEMRQRSRATGEEVPEAVALSPDTLFVMAPPHPVKWRWFRNAPAQDKRGKGGVEFTLNGPSIITFKPSGITIDSFEAWTLGHAVFEEPLRDDWHLVAPDAFPALLVRIKKQR